MARIRTIKPGFWTDEKLAEVPRGARLTFAGIISACADDAGRFKANPRVVRGAIYALDDTVTVADVAAELEQLGGIGVVTFYTVNGERFGLVVNWTKHQKIDRPTPSQLPPPPPDSSSPRRVFDEDSSSPRDRAERSGAEGNGVERSGADARAHAREANTSRERQGGSVRDRFIATFYHDAPPRTVQQVTRELVDVAREGVRVGKHCVRAINDAHVDEVLEETLTEAGRIAKPHSAWGYALRKLQDTSRKAVGRVTGEEMAKHAEEDTALSRRYQTARAAEIDRWRKTHAAEYAAIEQRARAAQPGETGIASIMREGLIQDEAGRACGFPDEDTWRAQRRAS